MNSGVRSESKHPRRARLAIPYAAGAGPVIVKVGVAAIATRFSETLGNHSTRAEPTGDGDDDDGDDDGDAGDGDYDGPWCVHVCNNTNGDYDGVCMLARI